MSKIRSVAVALLGDIFWTNQIVHMRKLRPSGFSLTNSIFLASHYKDTSNSRLSWNNVYLLDVLGEMLRQVTRPEFDQFKGSITDKKSAD